LLLKAIAAGRLSQAGHAPAQADCVRLGAFQRLSCGLPSRSNLIVFPCPIFSANEKQWGFWPWQALDFERPPTPALFFCTFSVARLYCRFTCRPAQTLHRPHPSRARTTTSCALAFH
jgi:hypothetical protein